MLVTTSDAATHTLSLSSADPAMMQMMMAQAMGGGGGGMGGLAAPAGWAAPAA